MFRVAQWSLDDKPNSDEQRPVVTIPDVKSTVINPKRKRKIRKLKGSCKSDRTTTQDVEKLHQTGAFKKSKKERAFSHSNSKLKVVSTSKEKGIVHLRKSYQTEKKANSKKILNTGLVDVGLNSCKKKGKHAMEDTTEQCLTAYKSGDKWSKVADQLNAARFRYINEQIYKMSGKEASEMFKDDPEAFRVYHEGFQNQVKNWPQNPLNHIIHQIKKQYGRERKVIADFGCGDAELARQLADRHQCYSFDLVPLNDRVTVCDVANVPLADDTCDAVVFCLSLMGTNAGEYLQEANRVLKIGGQMKIAEVKSRIAKMKQFTRSIENIGFSMTKQNDSNLMFALFDFTKTRRCCTSDTKLYLKPCLYKKR